MRLRTVLVAITFTLITFSPLTHVYADTVPSGSLLSFAVSPVDPPAAPAFTFTNNSTNGDWAYVAKFSSSLPPSSYLDCRVPMCLNAAPGFLFGPGQSGTAALYAFDWDPATPTDYHFNADVTATVVWYAEKPGTYSGIMTTPVQTISLGNVDLTNDPPGDPGTNPTPTPETGTAVLALTGTALLLLSVVARKRFANAAGLE